MVAAHRLGIHTHGLDYDMLLASYLINNEITPTILVKLPIFMGIIPLRPTLKSTAKVRVNTSLMTMMNYSTT